MKRELNQAVELRRQNRVEEAMFILQKLLQEAPLDPDVNYQIAWTFDILGKESDAVGFYETALTNGLVEDRRGAFLGLGSTYRCLGEYEKSIHILDQGVTEFPADRALKAFRALTLFNLGRSEESVKELLLLLLDTTTDERILTYERALRFYWDKLREKWR